MYDTAQNPTVTYAIGGALSSAPVVGQQLANQGTRQPLVSDAVLKELAILLEKATSVASRQNNLRERIFGPAPCEPTSGIKESPIPSGLLHQMNYSLQALQATMDRIILNCGELERLA